MGEILLYSGIIVLLLFSVYIFIRFFKKKIHFLWSSLLGLIGLAGVNILGAYTGVALGYGVLIMYTSVVLGLPGVALMLLIKLL